MDLCLNLNYILIRIRKRIRRQKWATGRELGQRGRFSLCRAWRRIDRWAGPTARAEGGARAEERKSPGSLLQNKKGQDVLISAETENDNAKIASWIDL